MAARPGVRKTVFLMILFIAGILYLTLGRLVQDRITPDQEDAPQLQELGVVVFPEPQTIDTFTLLDQAGERVAKPNLRGRWTIAFLGYTGCGEAACEDVFETLGKFAANVEATTDTQPRFWFVTVDPQRDNPATLRDYLQPYDFGVRGVTGKPQELQSFARSIKGAFSPAQEAGSAARVEFSGHLAIISPNAHLVAIAQQPFESRELAEAYRQLLVWYGD